MKIIFCFFELFIVYGFLTSWFDTRQITLRDGTLTRSGGLFGIGAPVTFSASEIRAITSSMSSQSGSTTYYRVTLKTKDNKEHTLCSGLLDKNFAEQLKDDLTGS